MGFYGKITHTGANTNFKFDKIYNNRKEMDDQADYDGVYIGRFVLVEYGEEDYSNNFEVDKQQYGVGRGFDSTVWQKTFQKIEIEKEDGTKEEKQIQKYVMIAELNTVIPTFKITADAPTMMPLEPHFDKDSNNQVYWLHTQPAWGMRVKEAIDENYSDENVIRTNSKWNNVTNKIDETVEEVAANIYYNKDGFSKEKQSFVEDLRDNVSVTATGVSGNIYQGHDNNPSTAPDIQEISIVLPSIGNAISDAWDVVYGAPEAANNKRNLDIEWDSSAGVRMIEEGTSGYKYNSKNAESLAGCINSVHDLMGMIIEEANIVDAKDADENLIYYNNNNNIFERKHTTYDYTEVDGVKDSYSYEAKNGLDLLKWENKYHYLDSLENYIIDNSATPTVSRNYYNIIPSSSISLTPEYIADEWWLLDNGNYIKAVEKEKIENATYYDVEEVSNKDVYWYVANEYVYKKVETDQYYSVATDASMNVDYIYYRAKSSNTEDYYKISQLPSKTITYQENGKVITITTKVYPEDVVFEKISLTQFEQKTYYKKNYLETYTLLTSIPSDNDGVYADVYEIKAQSIPPFYKADIYYFKTKDGYLKDKAGKFDKDKDYRQLTSINKITNDFYIKGKYFEKVNGSYIISSDEEPKDKIYYIEKKYYVINDELGNLPKGMEWNTNIISWPSTLHIGIRNEKYEMQELKGFARSFNTIHGLILEIRRLLDTDHVLTRDINTVQGAINKLNDIIAKFEDLQPGKLILVDNYGRIHPTDTVGDRWLEWVINADPVNPSIEILHNTAQEAEATFEQRNKAPKFGEIITTPKIEIDARGHVSTFGEEEIVLPKPSLTDNNISGVLTAMSMDDTNGKITNTFTHLSDVKLDGYNRADGTGSLKAEDTLEIALSKIENNITFTNEAIEELDTVLSAADINLQTNIDTLNTNLENISSSHWTLESTVSTHTDKITNLENAVSNFDNLNNRIDEVEESLTMTDDEIKEQIGSINETIYNKSVCSIKGVSDAIAGPDLTCVIELADDFVGDLNSAFTKGDKTELICPYNGIVLISGSVYFNSDTESCRGVYIMKNNEEVISSYGCVYRAMGVVSSGCGIIPVVAGDRISMIARSSVEIPILGNNYGTNLSITYL